MLPTTIAIWALTPGGAILGERISRVYPEAVLFLPDTLPSKTDATTFTVFSETLAREFERFGGHVFIMATGIVVRMIAPLLVDKTRDPAVVVMDERGLHAISLISGHIGGANSLTIDLAKRVGVEPVITTATDLNTLPAIDVMAVENGLRIENPGAIRHVSMALLKKAPVWLWDPLGVFRDPPSAFRKVDPPSPKALKDQVEEHPAAGVLVSDIHVDLPPEILVLRPASLVAGMGCNRHTAVQEMEALLGSTLAAFQLAPKSLVAIATVDIKKDEAGLLELSRRLAVPLIFYTREELQSVQAVPSPSETVQKHIGVQSVCEAAALLGAKTETLVVPKQKTPNVTLAIARTSSMS